MVKTIVLVAALFLVFSCTEQRKRDAKSEVADTETTTSNDDNANEARQWLIRIMTDFFATDELSSLDELMQKITTVDYYAYKTDATNVDLGLDGSLTEAQFYEKWKSKFDTSKAGIGTGFLISGQDWDKIEVERCELVSATETGFLFDVVLSDEAFQSKYPSKILVVHSADGYKIADVEE